MDDGLSCEKHLIPKAEAMEGHGLYHQISVFVYVEIGLVSCIITDYYIPLLVGSRLAVAVVVNY